jgi:hypothetical protein
MYLPILGGCVVFLEPYGTASLFSTDRDGRGRSKTNIKMIVGGTAAALILGSVAFAQTNDANMSQTGTNSQQLKTAPS